MTDKGDKKQSNKKQ